MSSARRPDWKRASVFRVECDNEDGFVEEMRAGKYDPLDPLDTVSTCLRPTEVLAQSPTREQQAMRSAQKQASAKKLGWARVPRPLFKAMPPCVALCRCDQAMHTIVGKTDTGLGHVTAHCALCIVHCALLVHRTACGV